MVGSLRPAQGWTRHPRSPEQRLGCASHYCVTASNRACSASANAVNVGGDRRCYGSRGACAPVCTCSGLDPDDRIPVSRMLVGIRDPHEEWVIEEAADELHADGETG